MKKRIKKLNLSRRNFLTGTATLAGIAATASVVPITIANANHTKGEKVYQILLVGKIEMH